jgi:S1-C subfamily serine protease
MRNPHAPRPRDRHATRRAAPLLVGGLAAALGLSACTAGGGTSTAAASTSPTSSSGASGASSLQASYENVIQTVLPSVVEITTGKGLGSGIVFDKRGDIVTNAHVVGNATSFQVSYANSTTPHPATLVGTYAPDDLAVIRVQNPAAVTPATFADSAKITVGNIVLAMGNPLGLSSSVTNGIVSAVGRTVSEPQGPDSPGATLPQAIQTSASINPGNSGGALVDLSGQVIGIPTLAATDPQLGGGAAPGIGFAIPSNVVTDIAGQLASSGHVTNSHRAAIGATVTTVTDASGRPAGVGVTAVTPGGPAASAGIQAGDVITSLAGRKVADVQQLAQILAGLDVGKTVPVAIDTGGTTKTIQVTLGQLAGS